MGPLTYAAEYSPEDEPLLAARANAADLGGTEPVHPAVGATLRFLACAVGARAVVEIGTGCGSSGIWLLRGMRPGSTLTVGGIGDLEAGALANVKGSILAVDAILYVSAPDNAWALDAHDGHEIWHYVWKTRGGTHIGNRGLGMWHSQLYMETPDDVLICLDAKTGKEIWHKDIADFDLQYFSTPAPIVVGNHILAGTGNDLDEPGFIESFDPETGNLQWRFYTIPMKKGDPGLQTWANLDAARHGGGNAWVPGSYDPETHLYIFGTGNPTPAYTTGTRGEGDNLYTC